MYIFYDSEATGLNRDFSQVLQLAFVHADGDLNIIASKDISSRRNPWTIPSPGALLITGFTPDDLKNAPLSHFEMMEQADSWLRARHWPVTFIGYNTMNFDEDVLRQAFHQTLHDPYLTTGRKEPAADPNTRADLLKIVKAASVYAPGVLKLDIKNEFGTPSLSLGNVTRQNGVGLSEDEAHDAMADTKATLTLAKLIKTAAPAVWDHMMTLTSKDGVDDFLSQNKLAAFTDHAYGKADSRIMTAVMPFNGNQHILFDLTSDPAPVMAKSVEELAEILKARGEERMGQPLRSVAKNKHPILMPLDMADVIRPAGLDDTTLNARAEAVRSNPEFARKLKDAVAIAYPPLAQGKEAEQQIYSFAPNEARGDLARWMRQFREGDWDQRAALIDDFPKRFDAAIKKQPSMLRFAEFAERIVFADAPEKLGAERQKKMAEFVAHRAFDTTPDAPWMTLSRARAELDAIEVERKQGIKKWEHVTDGQMRSLKLYYTALEKEISEASGIAPPSQPATPPVMDNPPNPAKDNNLPPPMPPIWR